MFYENSITFIKLVRSDGKKNSITKNIIKRKESQWVILQNFDNHP